MYVQTNSADVAGSLGVPARAIAAAWPVAGKSGAALHPRVAFSSPNPLVSTEIHMTAIVVAPALTGTRYPLASPGPRARTYMGAPSTGACPTARGSGSAADQRAAIVDAKFGSLGRFAS